MNPYNTNVPTPLELFKYIYQRIREWITNFGDRFGLDHYIGSSTNTGIITGDGYHKQLTMNPQSSDPDLLTGSHIVYCKNVNGVPQLFHSNADGVFQLTESTSGSLKLESDFSGSEQSLSNTNGSPIFICSAKKPTGDIIICVLIGSSYYIIVDGVYYSVPHNVAVIAYNDGYYFTFNSPVIKRSSDLVNWETISGSYYYMKNVGKFLIVRNAYNLLYSCDAMESVEVLDDLYDSGYISFFLFDGFVYGMYIKSATYGLYRVKYIINGNTLTKDSVSGVLITFNSTSLLSHTLSDSDELSSRGLFLIYDYASSLYKLYSISSSGVALLSSASEKISQFAVFHLTDGVDYVFFIRSGLGVYKSINYSTPVLHIAETSDIKYFFYGKGLFITFMYNVFSSSVYSKTVRKLLKYKKVS